MICVLCKSADCTSLPVAESAELYYACSSCDLRFIDPALHLAPEAERERYLLHTNDAADPDYQRFVSPLVAAIQERVKPDARVLDYGSGPGSGAAYALEQSGFGNVVRYDPHFFPDLAPLAQPFDAIFACEVVEHFYRPREEFARLKQMLKSGGIFAAMTHIYGEEIDFDRWYYRRDPTHVCFYSKKTFTWIANAMGFSKVEFPSPKVCVLQA